MDTIVTIVCGIILLVGFVVFFGPPYVPTLTAQAEAALDLLDLQPGQTMLELGSGDGRVMLAAARRGWNVVGIELSPILVLISIIVTWKYRKQVRVYWGSYWHIPWPPADGIFTFILPRYIAKLDAHVETWHTGTIRLASNTFTIDTKAPIAHKDGVVLYEYTQPQ